MEKVALVHESEGTLGTIYLDLQPRYFGWSDACRPTSFIGPGSGICMLQMQVLVMENFISLQQI